MQRATQVLQQLKKLKDRINLPTLFGALIVLFLIGTFTTPKVLNSASSSYRDEIAYAPASEGVEVSGGNGGGFFRGSPETVGGNGSGGGINMPTVSAEYQRAKAARYEMEMKAESPAQSGDLLTLPAHAAATNILKPQIIKTASLTLEVENIVDSVKLVEGLTTGHGGLVTNKQVSIAGDNNQYRSGSLQVRVPQVELDKYLTALRTLGIARSETVSSEDVGAEVTDLQSRIRNAQAQEKVLLGIMNRAGKIPEVLEVSNALSQVRENIEQMQGRLNYLSQQVAYSTVNIQLTEEALVSPTQGKPGFLTVTGNAAKRAFGDLIDFINNFAAAIVGLLVFWVPVLTVLALTGFLLWKLFLKRLCTTLMSGLEKPGGKSE